jgi:phosphopantetheinyl transferase (holo-ACP synthase)
MIGNDIVDLRFFDSPPYQNIRYLERICTPVEALAIRQSKFPNQSLAIIWASKEAAYKLFSRGAAGLHFVPRSFVTSLRGEISNASPIELWVLYGDAQARVKVDFNDQWVHATATFTTNTIVRWRVRRFAGPNSPGNWAFAESEGVRRLVKEMLLESSCKDIRLEFTGKIPTLAGTPGDNTEMGVSLSHHGAFVAAAIGWFPASFGTNPMGDCSFMESKSSGATCFTCTA